MKVQIKGELLNLNMDTVGSALTVQLAAAGLIHARKCLFVIGRLF